MDAMKLIPNNFIDSIVTDVPYGIKFMDNKWDYSIPSVDVFAEMLRVAKPGAMFMCFGGTRTYHRIVCNIEDAGWEIRDTIMWIYGSSPAKGMNIGKKMKKEGIEDAELWDGYWTTLKPLYEPICVAMKPLDGTFIDNAIKHGVAGLNIDKCRIGNRERTNYGLVNSKRKKKNAYGKPSESADFDSKKGRFPSNVVHDGSQEVMDEFAKYGESKGSGKGGSGKRNSTKSQEYWSNGGGGFRTSGRSTVAYGDKGTPARFFYCAKASAMERGESNDHPTVKPLGIMEYLCKLTMVPDGGVVLDPYAGSGTTALACIRTGREYILIDNNEKYCEIAKNRIELFSNSKKDDDYSIYSSGMEQKTFFDGDK